MKIQKKKVKKCDLCQKNALLELDDKNLCEKHFSESIERKVKRYTRQSQSLDKNQTILALEPVSEFFLTQIIKIPLNMITKDISHFKISDLNSFGNSRSTRLISFIKANRIQKIVLPWTADNEIKIFLDSFLTNEPIKPIPDDYIKMFLPIPELALKNYCKIKKIPYTPQKRSDLIEKLDLFESRYPGTKNALLKSSAVIEFIKEQEQNQDQK